MHVLHMNAYTHIHTMYDVYTCVSNPVRQAHGRFDGSVHPEVDEITVSTHTV